MNDYGRPIDVHRQRFRLARLPRASVFLLGVILGIIAGGMVVIGIDSVTVASPPAASSPVYYVGTDDDHHYLQNATDKTIVMLSDDVTVYERRELGLLPVDAVFPELRIPANEAIGFKLEYSGPLVIRWRGHTIDLPE